MILCNSSSIVNLGSNVSALSSSIEGFKNIWNSSDSYKYGHLTIYLINKFSKWHLSSTKLRSLLPFKNKIWRFLIKPTTVLFGGIGGTYSPGNLWTRHDLSKSNSLYLLNISKLPSLSSPYIIIISLYCKYIYSIDIEILALSFMWICDRKLLSYFIITIFF